VRVYRVVAGGGAAPDARPVLALADKPVAVLPFQNIGGDSDQG
jgi:TolB-like protein